MHKLILSVKAGQLSEELARRGVAAHTRVYATVEIPEAKDMPMAALAQAGGAFDFLTEEPDLYTDADAIDRNP